MGKGRLQPHLLFLGWGQVVAPSPCSHWLLMENGTRDWGGIYFRGCIITQVSCAPHTPGGRACLVHPHLPRAGHEALILKGGKCHKLQSLSTWGLNSGVRDNLHRSSGGSVVENPPANAGGKGFIPTWEDPTCLAATKPMCHNYCAQDLQLLKPMYVALVFCNKRSHCNKLAHRH